MTSNALALALALAVPLSACVEQPCDEIFIPALSVSVVDDQGDPVEEATVTFVLDGDASGDCIEDGVGVYVCGSEGGDYVISVEAEGFEDASTMVTVEADACHPQTEDPEIVLTPAP